MKRCRHWVAVTPGHLPATKWSYGVNMTLPGLDSFCPNLLRDGCGQRGRVFGANGHPMGLLGPTLPAKKYILLPSTPPAIELGRFLPNHSSSSHSNE